MKIGWNVLWWLTRIGKRFYSPGISRNGSSESWTYLSIICLSPWIFLSMQYFQSSWYSCKSLVSMCFSLFLGPVVAVGTKAAEAAAEPFPSLMTSWLWQTLSLFLTRSKEQNRFLLLDSAVYLCQTLEGSLAEQASCCGGSKPCFCTRRFITWDIRSTGYQDGTWLRANGTRAKQGILAGTFAFSPDSIILPQKSKVWMMQSGAPPNWDRWPWQALAWLRSNTHLQQATAWGSRGKD